MSWCHSMASRSPVPHRRDHVVFVVVKMALGHVFFSESFSFTLSSLFYRYSMFTHVSSGGWTADPLVTVVPQKHNLTHKEIQLQKKSAPTARNWCPKMYLVLVHRTSTNHPLGRKSRENTFILFYLCFVLWEGQGRKLVLRPKGVSLYETLLMGRWTDRYTDTKLG
jgi:hypothetical protein